MTWRLDPELLDHLDQQTAIIELCTPFLPKIGQLHGHLFWYEASNAQPIRGGCRYGACGSCFMKRITVALRSCHNSINGVNFITPRKLWTR